MLVSELQHVVVLEAICLLLIGIICVSAFYRWKMALATSMALATIAFFTAWSTIMATASLLVYGTAPILLWMQLDEKALRSESKSRKYTQILAWTVLAVGVAVLILNNIRNILAHLH